MAGFFSRLFGGSSAATCCYVGHWCETPIKFSNKVETPLGSKVTKVKVCVDIWYSVKDGQIVVERVRLSKGGSSLGGKSVNVATMRGEAFCVARICDEAFLKQAVENDLEDDKNLRKRMLAKWRGEHGSEPK
jgi:hypothetical protein